MTVSTRGYDIATTAAAAVAALCALAFGRVPAALHPLLTTMMVVCGATTAFFMFGTSDARETEPRSAHEVKSNPQTERPSSRQIWLRDESRAPSWLTPYLRSESRRMPSWKELSPWSRSWAKRVFDCACVLVSLPVLVPLMLLIAAAVRFTSPGPVLFLQQRVGSNGRTFTILKFRTMVHAADAARHSITTSNGQRFTLVGPFLRRWKLDELPQLANVLLGHMSLVGPRPQMPEDAIFDPPWRPGITGLATMVFAREDRILSYVARERLDDFVRHVVLPTKRQLDVAYMAHATFLSDLRLLVRSVLRRWDTTALDEFVVATAVLDSEGSAAWEVGRNDDRMRAQRQMVSVIESSVKGIVESVTASEI